MKEFTIQGSGRQIRINDNDFKASGGQASVYVQGATAFKVYGDPSQMIPPGKSRSFSP